MKRLLCILSGMNAGGAETFLMKIYRQLDKTLYQMDFCINVKEPCFYEDEINAMHGKVYRIPSKSENLKEFISQLHKIISENNYEYVLRITSNAAGFLDLKIAKKAGAKVCAARSSNSSDGKGIKVRIAHMLGKFLYGKYVDVRIAPSDKAAVYTFGEKALKTGEVHILKNGLNIDAFQFSQSERELLLKTLHLENKFVVGHIGRFNTQKNHEFLLDIFAQIKKKKENAVLVLIGKGELQGAIKEKADKLDLSESVFFLGVRSDVPQLLSVMDVFVFPSFYEGMPNTVIEAQASGLPCLISDTITAEAGVTDLVRFESLKSSAVQWADKAIEITQNRNDRSAYTAEMKSAGYDIEDCVKRFTEIIFKKG